MGILSWKKLEFQLKYNTWVKVLSYILLLQPSQLGKFPDMETHEATQTKGD